MNKKEYKVTAYAGFDKKELYLSAESASEVQEKIEDELAFEISEGMRYKIELLQ